MLLLHFNHHLHHIYLLPHHFSAYKCCFSPLIFLLEVIRLHFPSSFFYLALLQLIPFSTKAGLNRNVTQNQKALSYLNSSYVGQKGQSQGKIPYENKDVMMSSQHI